MALRDVTFEKFGPMLLEAIVDSFLEEINEIRTELSLPVVPKEQFLGKLNNNINHLEPYEWLEGGPHG